MYNVVDEMFPSDIVIPKSVTLLLKNLQLDNYLNSWINNPLSKYLKTIECCPGGLTRERAGFEVRDVHSHTMEGYAQ